MAAEQKTWRMWGDLELLKTTGGLSLTIEREGGCECEVDVE